MLEFLNQGWVGAAIGILGLAAGVVGIFLYRSSRIGGRPTCQMRTLRLIGKKEQELPEDVDIQFREVSVPRLSMTRLYFWNSGKETIRGNQVVEDDRLRCVFEPPANILKVHVAVATRAVNKFKVEVLDDAKNEAILSFDFLDPHDGVKLEILHTAKERYPRIKGTIRGIPSGVNEIPSFPHSRIDNFFIRYMRQRKLIIGIALVLGIILFLGAFLPTPWLEAIKSNANISDDPNGEGVWTLRIGVGIAGIIYTVMPLSYFVARRKKYPVKLDRDKSLQSETDTQGDEGNDVHSED